MNLKLFSFLIKDLILLLLESETSCQKPQSELEWMAEHQLWYGFVTIDFIFRLGGKPFLTVWCIIQMRSVSSCCFILINV